MLLAVIIAAVRRGHVVIVLIMIYVDILDLVAIAVVAHIRIHKSVVVVEIYGCGALVARGIMIPVPG